MLTVGLICEEDVVKMEEDAFRLEHYDLMDEPRLLKGGHSC